MISAERILLPIITLLILLSSWHMLAISGVYTEYQFPGPLAVFQALAEMVRDGTLWEHINISLYRFGIAFALAIIIGISLGLITGWKTRLNYALDPFIQILRPISPIAWFPLAVLWFEIGNPPAIFIIFISAFFPILLTTITAVKGVDRVFLQVARNFGTSGYAILRKVIVPAAFPNIMTGLHIALGTAWIHLVAGEMLGAQSGLGFMIIDARNFLRTDQIIGGMLVIGLIGLILDKLMGWIESKIKLKWGY